MKIEFDVANIIAMMDKEQNSPNGNIETVLDYILELERSGKYSPANICNLKSVYYRRIDDEESSYYWCEQATLLDPEDTFYLHYYCIKLMDRAEYKKALLLLDRIMELEKAINVEWHFNTCHFLKSVCYYYLKDYKNCYLNLKDLEDDFVDWVAGDLHTKKDMMLVLRGFGYR